MSDTHAEAAQLAFVRQEPIPPAPPPVAEAGIVRWLRDNLFSSIPNAILTPASLWAIWLLPPARMPWVFNGVWGPGSPRQ
mgnify:CR=1 FL=1